MHILVGNFHNFQRTISQSHTSLYKEITLIFFFNLEKFYRHDSRKSADFSLIKRIGWVCEYKLFQIFFEV